MKKLTRALLTAALLGGAVVVIGVAPAVADGAESGGDAIIRTGNCSGSADWKLKAKARDGGYEVEYEIDSNSRGQAWRYTLRQNGVVISQGTRTTQFGLGVRARLPFRVMKLGNRVIIDVAHHW